MTAPRTAKALPRFIGGKSSWMKAVTGGKKMPPPRPWITRATMSWVGSWARPAHRLARVNRARPTTNTHLWPMRSPMRPAGMSTSPKARA